MNEQKLNIGDQAPDFCLPNQDEKKICLSNYNGKNVVLYFYPKDNTPGCSLEAMMFTKYKAEFEKLNTTILGISKDSCSSHRKFIENKKLNLTLISDSEKKVKKNPMDRSAWESLSDLYLKEQRYKDMENALMTLLKVDARLGKSFPYTYRQLAEIYLAALSVHVRGKGICIVGNTPSNVTAESLGYSIEKVCELAKETLGKSGWAYKKERRDLAIKAACALTVEAFEEFERCPDI